MRAHIFLLTIMGLLFFCSASRALPADGLQLTESNRSQFSILLAPDASVPEKNAASELAYFLHKITGINFNIVGQHNAKMNRVIAVGPGAVEMISPTLPLERSELGDDGIVIKTERGNLLLTGAKGSRRGTLYAVYTFLEDICGVRWWTEDYSSIPSIPDLAVDALNIRYVPTFRYREALYRSIAGYPYTGKPINNQIRAKFQARSKFNGHHHMISEDWGGSYYLLGWCHTFYTFLPPNKYFEVHPEWYSEINGKRQAQQGQLCCTNDEMIAELTKVVLNYIKEQPAAGMISVSQNDWKGNCQCAKCRALDEAEESPSASLLYCVNKVAEEVEKEYPDFLIETLAYSYTRKPPKTVRPRNNVLIRLAVIERSGAQPIDSKNNRKLMDDLEVWRSAAPNLFIWDYTADMFSAFTPHPNLSVFGADARTYATNNVVGVFNEGNHYSGEARGDFDELKTYVMSHVLWDPKTNVKKLVSEFLYGFYGEAAPALQKYLDLIEAKSRSAFVYSCGDDGDALWMNLDTMNRAVQLFDKAEHLVSKNPVLQNRVKRARLPLDHQWLISYSTYSDMAARTKKPFYGPKDVQAATEDFLANVKKYEGENIRAEGALNWEQYAVKMGMFAQNNTAPTPLPAEFADLPADSVAVAQLQDFRLHPGADLVEDAKAASGYAAKMDPSVLSWSVQMRKFKKAADSGRWRVYASIRCEKIKDTGVAVTAGIYDIATGKNLVGLTVNIEDNAPAQKVDPNIDQLNTIVSQKGAGDGEYHLYDLGAHELSNHHYIWFGTTGGVSPKNVKAIYIDRIIFVKE